jgi:hypothetical protein
MRLGKLVKRSVIGMVVLGVLYGIWNSTTAKEARKYIVSPSAA